ncbi:MAG: KEOPS complex N(6)-L-threonylcarbamoyladenine synthase Kae1 [Aigarchaeota archaeon]|nr:KEOPS complex N(6)-L-threonylcarbamoyladenine synthase Kae1 [Aigarchaeota archaeon]MDW8092634.1 KEOPS complex N(6)-L-threonylcarbamoyladenine synthase Kae1 [Nitrososphaerota archaeon]
MEEGFVSLGIESTAHTFGVGVVRSDGKILANEYSVYRPVKGGIHPREAAQHHSMVASKVLASALEKSSLSPRSIDVVAFSIGPGMGPCLRTGATVARALALKLGVPLVGVNHGVAHIEIGKLLTGARDPLVLYVAGGNTMITTYLEGRYRILGETLDIAAGNCLDSFGITAGIGPMPAPEIHAKAGKVIHPLPLRVKGMEVSFSGLLTAAESMLSSGVPLPDVCLSITESVYSMLTEVLERALAMTKKEEVLIVGGLAKSRRLREMIELMVRPHNAKLLEISDEYLGDNGAMIAWTGALMHAHGMHISIDESRVRPKYRINEVEIPWGSPV